MWIGVFVSFFFKQLSFFLQFFINRAGLNILGRHEDGKVAIRDLAIECLDQMPGAHFIRVIDEVGMTDGIAPRYQIELDAPLRLARMPEDVQDLT